MGDTTIQFNSVGILVVAELAPAIVEIEGVGGPRRKWYIILARPTVSDEIVCILCAFYAAAPCGDAETWTLIINDYRIIRARHPHERC